MLPSTANNCVTLQTVRRCFSASLVGQRSRYQRDQLTSGWGIRCLFECSCNDWKVTHTGGALAANPRPLQTHLSCPACIASGNFTLEFPSINSRSRLFSRWRIRARKFQNEITHAMHAGQERWVWRGRHLQCWEMPALYLGYLYIDLWLHRSRCSSHSLAVIWICRLLQNRLTVGQSVNRQKQTQIFIPF